jgi:hypothetical protein
MRCIHTRKCVTCQRLYDKISIWIEVIGTSPMRPPRMSLRMSFGVSECQSEKIVESKLSFVTTTYPNGTIRLQSLHLVDMGSRRVVLRPLCGDVRRRKSQPMPPQLGLSPGAHSSYVPPSISPLLESIPWGWFAGIDEHTSRSRMCGVESDSKETLLHM